MVIDVADEPLDPSHAEAADLVGGNRLYAANFTAGHLGAVPLQGLAVLTCMDARVMPGEFLGLSIGDLHVIRNAGGRATPDAIRSLTVSTRLLATWQIAVIHHTDCGNTGSHDELAARLRAAGVEEPPTRLYANEDPVAAVLADVTTLRDNPMIADDVVVSGYLYDVHTGRLEQLA